MLGTIFINFFLDSDQSYQLECNKVKEGKLLLLNEYWVIGFPVLGFGQGLGGVLVHILEYMFSLRRAMRNVIFVF